MNVPAGLTANPHTAGAAEPWPLLRQELALFKGPVSSHGAPSYTLHDPVAHRFFRLGWLEMEILSRWLLADPEAIVQDIRRATTLDPTPDDIRNVLLFVRANNLTLSSSPADSGRLLTVAKRQKLTPLMFLVKNYLFLRLPLLNPDRFLERTLPLVRPLFSRTVLWTIVAAALLGLALIARNAAFFKHDLAMLFSVQGAFMILVGMGLSKAVHELGHAYAAKLLGLRVPAMGIALMCFYPMLWTDTTEAWKCARRKDRLLIGLAGVGAELGLAALASLAWLLLPPGLWREMALTLTGVTWLSTVVINANPFMRYDAYYVMSDLFEMPMLQSRSFAMAKWWMRKKLLGLGHPPPEAMSPRAAVLCAIYAYSVWIYRFFLFLGIAFLVYYMFFKALGLVLFLVEIIWFLLWPIVRELREWFRERGNARLTPWGAGLVLVVLGFFIPWRADVVAPAMLDAEKSFTFYPPSGALLHSTPPPAASRFQAGQVLLELASPDLDFKLQAASLARNSLEQQLANAGLAPELWPRYAAQREELTGVMAEEASLAARMERLIFIAPFAGEVRESAADLTAGQWVGPKEPLLLVTGGRAVVEVLVPEQDVFHLAPGSRGVFIAGSGGAGGMGALPLKVLSVSPGTVTELGRPALASTKGGPLPVRQGPQGQLWPEQAVYLIRCEVENMERPPAALTGMANLKGERRSLCARAFAFIYTAVIRESGL